MESLTEKSLKYEVGPGWFIGVAAGDSSLSDWTCHPLPSQEDGERRLFLHLQEISIRPDGCFAL